MGAMVLEVLAAHTHSTTLLVTSFADLFAPWLRPLGLVDCRLLEYESEYLYPIPVPVSDAHLSLVILGRLDILMIEAHTTHFFRKTVHSDVPRLRHASRFHAGCVRPAPCLWNTGHADDGCTERFAGLRENAGSHRQLRSGLAVAEPSSTVH